jgi:hypothetical protein
MYILVHDVGFLRTKMTRLLAAFPVTCAFVLMAIGSAPAQEVTSEANGLNVIQRVRPATKGQFQAKVILPISGARATEVPNAQVTLLGSEGAVHRGVTNIHGDVTIDAVAPGIYAMTARARGLFACYAMHVVGENQAAGRSLPASAEISCALVTSHRFGETVLPYLAADSSRDHLQADDMTLVADVDRISNPTYRIARTAGGLAGSLRSANGQVAEQMNVFIFNKRKAVGRTLSDDQGRFVLADLPSGVYSMVAVGQDGVAALGFELVESVAKSARVNSTGETFVIQEGAEDATLDVDVIPVTPDELEEVVGIEEEEEDTEEGVDEMEGDGEGAPLLDEFGNPIVDGVPVDGFGNPLAGGGYAPNGGSYGGGGGGGSGGGGGGGIAAAALVAAAAAAVSSSNNNDFRPLVTSPNLPAN